MRSNTWILGLIFSLFLIACNEPTPPANERIEILPGAVLFTQLGQTKQLNANVIRTDGSINSNAVLTWDSSKPTDATVDAQGMVTAARDVGSATIHARVGDLSAEVPLTIAKPSPSTVMLPKNTVVSASQDGSQVTVTNTPETMGIQAGSVLVTDQGLVVKVTARAEQGNQIVLTTQPATFGDAFEKFDIKASSDTVTVANGKPITNALSGKIRYSSRVKLTCDFSPSISINTDLLELSTELSYKVKFELQKSSVSADVSWASYIEGEARVKLTGKVTLSASGGASLKCSIPVPSALKIPVATLFGLFNINGRVQGEIGIEFAANAGIKVGEFNVGDLVYKMPFKFGLQNNNNTYNPIKDASYALEPNTGANLKLSGDTDLTLSLKLSLGLKVGLSVSGGIWDALTIDLVKPYLALPVSFRRPIFNQPYTASTDYPSPSWDVSIAAGAELTFDPKGAVIDLFKTFGIKNIVVPSLDFKIFNVKILENPTTTVSPPALSVTPNTAVTLVANHVQHGLVNVNLMDAADSAVEFWAYPKTVGKSPFKIARTNFNPATREASATWTPTSSDVGAYTIKAMDFGLFGGLDLPYASTNTAEITVGNGTPPSALTITQTSPINLTVNQTQQLTATQNNQPATVTWASSDSSIASVNSSGLVTGVKLGSVTVTATLSSDTTKTASVGVNVSSGGGISVGEATTISAGEGFSLVVKPNNTLWSFGGNQYGQLGDGTKTYRNTPVQVMTGVSSINAGFGHSLVLKTNGSLWAFGWNDFGQLGDGITPDIKTPVQIMTRVSSISAGEVHSLVLKTDGSLWAFGLNHAGELGDGTNTDSNTPLQVMTGVSSISAGDIHSLVLKTDGSLWSFGWNDYGQLGDGTNTNRNMPVQVMTRVSSTSAGRRHSLVLKTDGSLWAFGSNYAGELGDGTNTNRNTPVQVMTGVKLP